MTTHVASIYKCVLFIFMGQSKFKGDESIWIIYVGSTPNIKK
jgi:hypothetical protein